MLSHIVEYECQYTDQIYKKRKIWHDGKLKYFQINNRFMLYTEKDNILLTSEFKTSSKELKAILNPEGFDIEEHRIFSQFLVIISGIIDEYDRDIQVTASHVRTDPPIMPVQKKQPVSSECVPTLNHISTPREIHSNTRVIVSKDKQKQDSAARGGFNISKLTLKVNKPFKKPKRILNANVVNELNRPSIRNKRSPETVQPNEVNHGIERIHEVEKIMLDEDDTVKYPAKTNLQDSKGTDGSEKKAGIREAIKAKNKRGSRIRKIIHVPLKI
ncbi:hypothetical protein N7582_002205 [Saccharomyces uvarum]|uniref:5'-3' DNA helicase ZGRF1-like N-terminal domain-containing protein n=1 Tax=Saccharomyces uvarum TaxID=230603 RepID=A0AA35JIU3_SACUV|nr:hypothetical protein N7582_002205 [Saccharomyces uvarum]CAI4062732.1 hypothetical protein SUVC_07G2810 [Saccharomyces uvarum]